MLGWARASQLDKLLVQLFCFLESCSILENIGAEARRERDVALRLVPGSCGPQWRRCQSATIASLGRWISICPPVV